MIAWCRLRRRRTSLPPISGARLEIMSDVGHHPMFEQPEVFNALLFDFLDGIARSDGWRMR